jgi:hypothetical protein
VCLAELEGAGLSYASRRLAAAMRRHGCAYVLVPRPHVCVKPRHLPWHAPWQAFFALADILSAPKAWAGIGGPRRGMCCGMGRCRGCGKCRGRGRGRGRGEGAGLFIQMGVALFIFFFGEI